MTEENCLTCAQIPLEELTGLLGRYGITLVLLPDGAPITGTWFGEPEAGIVGRSTYVRADTPVHSALHESCHMICMDAERRVTLDTDAGGDYDEENAVNYLQITLADYLPSMGRERMMQDMDDWGYTYRLGSARAWFERESAEARQFLIDFGVLDEQEKPTWRMRGE